AEYAVMLAVILVLAVGTVRLVGNNANNAFSSVASTIQSLCNTEQVSCSSSGQQLIIFSAPPASRGAFFVLCRYRAIQIASRQQRKRPSGCLRAEDVFPRDNSCA